MIYCILIFNCYKTFYKTYAILQRTQKYWCKSLCPPTFFNNPRMYRLVILGNISWVLLYFKGRHCVGNRLCTCWDYIRRKFHSGALILWLIKTCFFFIKLTFLLINSYIGLNWKSWFVFSYRQTDKFFLCIFSNHCFNLSTLIEFFSVRSSSNKGFSFFLKFKHKNKICTN